jgi:hypothetical protein
MNNIFVVNNPLKNLKSTRLKRNKGSRHLIPKLRFSNNVEERHIPYDNDNNYKTLHNIYSGRKGFRGKHRESINVNKTNKRYMPNEFNNNNVSKKRKNTLRKLKNKGNLFLNGGMVEKVNPLVEKKLQNLYNKREDLIKNVVNNSRKTKVKLDVIDLKIKEYIKNGYRGLRGSTRRIMNKVNNNLRNK